MSRALRVEHDGAIYHVMSRGVARMRTYAGDEDRRRFLEIVGRVIEFFPLTATVITARKAHSAV